MNPYYEGFARPLRGVGSAAIVFVWLAVGVSVVLLFVASHTFAVINRAEVDGPAVTSAVAAFGIASFAASLVYLVAAILYWVWSWRARCNAELLAGPRSQDLSRGWTFWGWFCPFVGLWFPCQILLDIARASAPRELRRQASRLVVGWWILLLAGSVLPGLIIGAAQSRVPAGATPDEILARLTDSFGVAVPVGLVLLVGAAIVLTAAIHRISAWQSTPRPAAV